jgi:hypothetical protein
MSQDQKVLIKSEIASDKIFPMKSPTLWIGVLALVILAIWAFGAVSAYQALSEAPVSNSLVRNPELSAARRYAEAARRAQGSDDMAVNPELNTARVYAEAAASESIYDLAANPELKVAQRYDEMANKAQEKMSAWIANPELSAANRFAETSVAGAEEADLYQNPELKVVASQSVILDRGLDSEFLATNPELKAHQRFVEGIDR